jgi:hypothetical protein
MSFKQNICVPTSPRCKLVLLKFFHFLLRLFVIHLQDSNEVRDGQHSHEPKRQKQVLSKIVGIFRMNRKMLLRFFSTSINTVQNGFQVFRILYNTLCKDQPLALKKSRILCQCVNDEQKKIQDI